MWEYVEFKVSCTRDFGRLLHHLDPYRLKHGKIAAMSLWEVPPPFFGGMNDLKWQLWKVTVRNFSSRNPHLFLLIYLHNSMMLGDKLSNSKIWSWMLFSWVQEHLWRWFFLAWGHEVKNKGLQQQLVYTVSKLTWLAGKSDTSSSVIIFAGTSF